MRRASVTRPGQRPEEEILHQAVQRLLRATKREAKKRGQPINAAQLRQEGYSERFIAQVEKA